jgi:hypothetical protein
MTANIATRQIRLYSEDAGWGVMIDPRKIAAMQLMLDALAHEAHSPDAVAAFQHARQALANLHDVLESRQLYLQVPKDYKPPRGLGCSGKS